MFDPKGLLGPVNGSQNRPSNGVSRLMRGLGRCADGNTTP